MTNLPENLSVSIHRTIGGQHSIETFDVPAYENQTVLDVVAWVQQHVDSTLSYRYSCRVGMCGSCAMTVNGIPRWTCRTHVSRVVSGGKMTISALENLPIIKDLVVDLDPFFAKWISAEAVHRSDITRADEISKVDIGTFERREADAGIECINCAVCYSACDTVAGNPEYLGPAALQRVWTLYNDERCNDKQSLLDAVSGSGGCHNCHSQGSCSVYCPNDLNPMKAIAGLKRATISSRFKSGE